MTTTMHELFGLRVRSDLPLGGRHRGGLDPATDLVLALAPPAAATDDVPAGELLARFVVSGRPVYSAADDGTEYRLRVHGLCDFVVDRALGTARCHPSPEADLRRVGLVARGAFLAWWLGLRGECVLHASAVDVDGVAVAFAGDSGMGKSTLAGWACGRGARFVTDDLLRLDPSVPAGWMGRAPELRLRPGAAEVVAAKEAAWSLGRSVDDRITALPPAAQRDDGPLGAVVVPRPSREARSLVVEQLDPLDAVLVLSRFPRLQGWVAARPLEVLFRGAADLAGSVPVVLATIPWGPPFAPAVMDELLTELAHGRRGNGLATAAGGGVTS